MKTNRTALALIVGAHALAWAASLWLTFGTLAHRIPWVAAQGDWATAEEAGRVGLAVADALSFVPIYGSWGLAIVLVPVTLTGAAVLALRLRRSGLLVVWGLSVAQAAFCFLSPVGWVYVPAAFLLVGAAVVRSFWFGTTR